MSETTLFSDEERASSDAMANWGFIRSAIIFSTYSILPYFSKMSCEETEPENTVNDFTSHKKGLFHEFNDWLTQDHTENPVELWNCMTG